MSNKLYKPTWSIDTIYEIICDLFCFDFLLEIKRRMQNEEAKAYVVNFLKMLIPIYVHEIANALQKFGFIEKKKVFSPEYWKRIQDERQIAAHENIVISEKAKMALAAMEIDFDSKIYDINIAVYDNFLYDLNFESNVVPTNDFEFWNFLYLLPRNLLNTIFSAISPSFNLEELYANNEPQINAIAQRLDDALAFSRYSYSTYRLFGGTNSLDTSDKILILYRYRMITAQSILSKYIPALYATIGERNIVNIDYFFTKYNALVIELIGKELHTINTSFTDSILDCIKAEIKESEFFRLNRKLRNNLHYESTDLLSDQEMEMVTKNQTIYLNIVKKYFSDSITINIDRECKKMTRLSNAFQASGLSKEEFDQFYYFYYLKFLLTGKI